MFTGLVTETGTVRALERSGGGARIEVEAALAAELEPGDSVSVGGVCLTAVTAADGGFAAEAMPETLDRSALGALAAGDRVNLELPLRASDRLGGHVVQGHVDGVGEVELVVGDGIACRVTIRADAAVCRYVVDKGSVAVDGVSLTALEPEDERFSVALVPETLERTTLGDLAAGHRVNVEVDVLAKYVERLGPAAARPEPAVAEARA